MGERTMRERVKWVDIAKFLGVFAIYLGHFGEATGYAQSFVFEYHVALFFLLSGCMSTYDTETNFGRFVVKKIKTIMVPYWLFCLMTIAVSMIGNNLDVATLGQMFLCVAQGTIRLSYFSGALWFLTCLFVMELIFKLFKYFKAKWFMLAICLILFVVAEKVIDPRPILMPHWYYNLDSAFYYIVYYAIGFIAYPYIQKLFKMDTLQKRVVFTVTGILSFAYAIIVFLGQDFVAPKLVAIPYIGIFVPIIKALILIWFNLTVAKLLEGIKLFEKIGRNTLYLCGNEYMLKTLIPCMMNIFGLTMELLSPFHCYLYVIVLLLAGVQFVIPAEQRIARAVQENFKRMGTSQ